MQTDAIALPAAHDIIAADTCGVLSRDGCESRWRKHKMKTWNMQQNWKRLVLTDIRNGAAKINTKEPVEQ